MKTFTTSTGNAYLVMDYGKNSIPTDDIKYIEGDGNYSNFQLSKGKSFISSFTLRTFTSKLNEERGFFSPRKGLLINLNYANEIVTRGNSKFIKMKDGKELQLSRRKGRELIDFLKDTKWDIGV
ncbi:LytTr DNA-binding domain-containing protein [Spirosomataceae bacterium TFI 002]|nr:LytTr DNA-binding domain-containing protein [Spirosomataceae bacterium TFI 002]